MKCDIFMMILSLRGEPTNHMMRAVLWCTEYNAHVAAYSGMRMSANLQRRNTARAGLGDVDAARLLWAITREALLAGRRSRHFRDDAQSSKA